MILHFLLISAFAFANKGNFVTVLQLRHSKIQITTQFGGAAQQGSVTPNAGNPIFHNKPSRFSDGWRPYFSLMKSSVSCVSVMCMTSSAKALARLLLPGFSAAAGGREGGREKNIRGGGRREKEKSPRHHLSRPFKELSSGGLRALAHFPIRASQPCLLSPWEPGAQSD